MVGGGEIYGQSLHLTKNKGRLMVKGEATVKGGYWYYSSGCLGEKRLIFSSNSDGGTDEDLA